MAEIAERNNMALHVRLDSMEGTIWRLFCTACDPGRPLAVCRRPPTREDSEITGHLLKQRSVNLFLQITNSHRCDMELQSVLPLLAFLLLAASLLLHRTEVHLSARKTP